MVDTNPVNLKRMETLARKVIEQEKVELKLEASTDAKEVLPEADFVVFSFADRSAKFRGIDCEVSAKYGVHSNQISKWKKQAIVGITEIFSGRHEREKDNSREESEELYKQIRKMKVENDFLKKTLYQS